MIKKDNMKNDSPNHLSMLGGFAAAGIGRKASAGGNFDRAKYERMAARPGIFGKMAQEVLRQNPVQAPVAPTPVAPVAPTPVAPTADMSAGAAMSGSAMDPTNPLEGKTFTLTPANMMGNAKPVFNEQTQGMAQTAFGSDFERQMSMPNSGSVTQIKSPLEGNAFTKAMADTGGDYEAAQEILKNK